GRGHEARGRQDGSQHGTTTVVAAGRQQGGDDRGRQARPLGAQNDRGLCSIGHYPISSPGGSLHSTSRVEPRRSTNRKSDAEPSAEAIAARDQKSRLRLKSTRRSADRREIRVFFRDFLKFREPRGGDFPCK